jgi:hypothetical protein
VAYTAARHTACRRIGCGWPVAGRAAAQATGIPAAAGIRGSRAAGRKGGDFLLFKNSRKSFSSSKNPRKSILTPKITKPFPENF